MKNVYFDMDGVLAEWREAATMSDLCQKGYFKDLAPTELIPFAKRMVKENEVEVYTLSAYIPESDALTEKKEWLDRYLPEVDTAHRLFVFNGSNKADFVSEAMRRDLTMDDILIDDYTKNLKEWQNAGGRAIKWLNGVNGTGGVFYGKRTSDTEELYAEILKDYN